MQSEKLAFREFLETSQDLAMSVNCTISDSAEDWVGRNTGTPQGELPDYNKDIEAYLEGRVVTKGGPSEEEYSQFKVPTRKGELSICYEEYPKDLVMAEAANLTPTSEEITDERKHASWKFILIIFGLVSVACGAGGF